VIGEPLEVHTHTDAGVTVARPVGELGAFNASQFRTAMEPITSASRLVIT